MFTAESTWGRGPEANYCLRRVVHGTVSLQFGFPIEDKYTTSYSKAAITFLFAACFIILTPAHAITAPPPRAICSDVLRTRKGSLEGESP